MSFASYHPGLGYAVEPGGLGPDHPAIIEALAGQGWGCKRIGREIRKHSSTVQRFLYRHGLRAPRPLPQGQPCAHRRNGTVVRLFSAEEDAYIQALRVQGSSTVAIARLATARFGHQRRPHVIHARLTMLAMREDGL